MKTNRFIEGWSYEDKPHWELFCPKCDYLLTIITHTKEGFKFSDVYKSCNSLEEFPEEYIINHSDEAGDYHSGITIKQLFSYYVAQSKGWFNKQ